MSNQAACHAVITRDKRMMFGKTFTAVRTAIASASVVENNRQTESRKVSDKLMTVVVYI